MKAPRLRYLRERRGLTQRELAENAGVALRSLAGWELGENIRPKSARKVAATLGVEIEDLCEEPTPHAFGSSPTTEDERTQQFFNLLRRYEQMEEQSENLDWDANTLKQLRGFLAEEALYAAARAFDRADTVMMVNIIERTRRALDKVRRQLVRAVQRTMSQAASTDPIEAMMRWEEAASWDPTVEIGGFAGYYEDPSQVPQSRTSSDASGQQSTNLKSQPE